MRKLSVYGVAILSCFCSGNLSAQQVGDEKDVCAMFGQLAESIMTRRQDGAAPSELRKAFAGNKVEKLVIAIIDAAYERARYSSDEMKKREIQDFRAMNETTCYKNFKQP